MASQVVVCAATLVVLATLVACGTRVAPPNADRERAYGANNLGVAHLEQFKYAEAAAEFRRALALDSSVAIARINLSIALFLEQDLAGAIREATESARLLPSSPHPSYILGLLARAESRDADAAGFFRRVLQIDPGDVGAKVGLARVMPQGGQSAEAIALLRSAVADEPYNITAVYSLGQALMRAGQRDEGERVLAQSQTLRATGYSTSYGNQYLEQGRYAEAIASTGAEADLVDTSVSPARWTASPVAGIPLGGAPSPYGRSFDPATLTPVAMRAIAAGLGGAVTLVDVDRDGNLDVFVSAPEGQRLLRNDGKGSLTDVTAASGLSGIPAGSVPIGAVTGDYDNDGSADLFVLRYGGSSLYRNDGRDASPTSREPRVCRRSRRCPRRRRSLTLTTTATWTLSSQVLPTLRRRAAAGPESASFLRTSRPRHCSCCATTRTAPSPTSRATRDSTARATRLRSSRPTSTTIATST